MGHAGRCFKGVRLRRGVSYVILEIAGRVSDVLFETVERVADCVVILCGFHNIDVFDDSLFPEKAKEIGE